jgi:hypothetical protein
MAKTYGSMTKGRRVYMNCILAITKFLYSARVIAQDAFLTFVSAFSSGVANPQQLP